MRPTIPVALCLMSLLGACVVQPLRPGNAEPDCGRPAEAGTQTRLNMIRKLLDTGHPYAALAHLDATGLQGPAAVQLRADILRRMGRLAEARARYEELLTTCMAGSGHHGLGLLAGQDGRIEDSVAHLRQASLALPVEARVRNDLGYALMLSNDLEAARFEFLTALDLDPEDRKAAHNLILLLHRQGETAAADALAERYRIGTEERTRLREEAGGPTIDQGGER
jgi:tetratricopeptide (TPR) repeat protein